MSDRRNPKIVELLAKADGNDDASAVVSIYNDILCIGQSDNLVYKRKVPAKKVCTHRRNRGDFGGSEWSAITVGETVFQVLISHDFNTIALDVWKIIFCGECYMWVYSLTWRPYPRKSNGL